MSANGAAIGKVAAELMEAIDASTVDEGGTATIGEVLVAAEVLLEWPDGTEATLVTCRCSDGRKWIQLGLLQEAERSILEGALTRAEVEDDDQEDPE